MQFFHGLFKKRLRFTCLGEKKEVTDPGIRSCQPNVGVARLCQVMDLSIYTQTSVPIGWVELGSLRVIGRRRPSVQGWVCKRQKWTSLTTQDGDKSTAAVAWSDLSSSVCSYSNLNLSDSFLRSKHFCTHSFPLNCKHILIAGTESVPHV